MENIWIDYLIRLSASLLCGFCLGIERKLRQHTVGIRTLTLICVSSCLLTIISVFLAEQSSVAGDPTRIAAAIITGIGFLGAGAIVNQGLNIRGLTSAAIIFTAAALGVACGAALYIPVLIVLAFSIFLLLIVGKIEHKLFPSEKRKIIRLEFSNDNIDEKQLRAIFTNFKIIIYELNTNFSNETGKTILTYIGKTPESFDTLKLTKELSLQPNVVSINIDN